MRCWEAAFCSSVCELNDPEMNSGDDVKLTKTGRISKAKKGLKDVHVCDCGKVSRHGLLTFDKWFI